MNELQKMADLASAILNERYTYYYHHKKLIAKIFNETNGGDLNDIILRLTIIDSFYSTNMSKLNNGIEEIAEEIIKFENDITIVKECNEFLKDCSDDFVLECNMDTLFNKKYGYNKSDIVKKEIEKDYGNHAISLISRYLYFISNFKFPIYDDLAFDSYILINNNYDQFNLKLNKYGVGSPNNLDIVKYFKNIIDLNESSNIKNYDKLDNFLWLIGKVKNGNYSLIVNKKDYKKMIKEINNTNKFLSTKSQDMNDHIALNLKENTNIDEEFEIKNNLKGKLKQFVEFAYNLN
jgi:hypothetical protein